MKNRLKKALSLLMALSILCSFAVLPASAATAGSNVEIKVEAGDWTGARGSEECEVTVWAEADEEFTLANATFALKFNKDLMTCADADVVANSAFANLTLNANGAAGVTCAMAAAGTNVVSSTNGRVDLLTVTFHIKSADSEKQTSKFEIVETGNGVLSAGSTDSEYNEISHTVTGGSANTVVPGTEPALNSVSLAKQAISEFNGAAETIQATAVAGTANVDATAMVDWSIAPTDKGVTIDAETGLISVAKNAQSATYTVTATPVAGQTSGEAKSADLTITRAAAAETTVTVSGPGTITVPKTAETPNSTASYTALVENQFGEVMEGQTVTWSVSGATTGVSIRDNVVTVTHEAVKDTNITVTANCGDKSGTKTVKLVDIEVTPVIKANPVYGDKWNQIVTGVTAKLGEDTVAGTFTVENANVMPAAGEGRTTNVTFKSTDGQYEVTVPVTVNVAKRPITITLPNNTASCEYDGEAHTAVTMTATAEVDGASLTCTPTAEVTGTDAGTYEVAYTCESDNYIVTVKGGDLVISKAEIPAEKVSQKPLESFKLYDDVEVSFKKEGKTITQISVRIAEGSATEAGLKKDLADANKRTILTIEDEVGNEYEFTIKSWKLKEGTTFKSNGWNTFVADELVGVDDDAVAYLANHAPVLPEFVVKMTASASGGSGSGGGSSSGWDWGDRGGQIIDITPKSVFTDVPDGYTFQKDIVWVYYRGIMKGTSATTFSPTSSTNRQQLWMVLGRLSGSNPGDMATARAWAKNTGVSDGTSPTGSLTRQQMVTMLYRWAQSKGYTGVASGSIAGYADASSVAGYAREAMAWAVGNGIISGSGNNLMPNGTATRAQFAAIMHRFCEKFGV